MYVCPNVTRLTVNHKGRQKCCVDSLIKLPTPLLQDMEDSLPDPVLAEGSELDLEPSGGSFDR